ncbi:MAG: hypothetical protein IJZ88_07995 [Clostridia bacterium]|nr:hypothetical protein [Clostridia bacterium]
MSKIVIRNKASKEIGYIRTDSKGKQTAYNNRNEKIGCFDPKLNQTKNHSGRVIGHGNLLASLILIAS